MNKAMRHFLRLISRLILWLPDKQFLQLRFRISMGQSLNLKNPKTFQEKIQWLKLYNRKPEYITMVDKNAVKDYVAKIIGKKYIIPTLKVWDKAEDINLDKLPDKFVIKTTHGGGSNGVIVCRDKSKLDIKRVKNDIRESLKSDIFKNYREWPYKHVPRKILAEELIEIPNKSDLTDYKIYCFNGTPKYIQVIQDRNTKETIDFFDTEWNHQPFVGLNPNCSNATIIPDKPNNFKEMLEIAKKLAQDIPFVRVDCYNVGNRIYFGELTFYPASGLGKFTPAHWDKIFGDMLQLT